VVCGNFTQSEVKGMKRVEDHPIEDVFGVEIYPGDVYWVFGKDVVNDINLKRFLLENQQVECFKAQD
jgi:hypothetical protein